MITCLHYAAQITATLKCRYLVPKASPEFRKRAGLALALLVGSKILNVQVPFFFKYTGWSGVNLRRLLKVPGLG